MTVTAKISTSPNVVVVRGENRMDIETDAVMVVLRASPMAD